MKKVQIMVYAVAGAMAVLAGLGLVVAGSLAPEMMGPHWFLKRQAFAVGLSICAAGTAALIPWRVWLKSAPWVFIGCLALLLASAANGCRYLALGAMKFDTWVIGWPVAALSLAWLRTKLPLSSSRLLLAAAFAGMACFVGGSLYNNADRVEQLHAFFTGDADTLPASPEAVERNERAQAAKAAYVRSAWIGESSPEVVNAVPLAHTAGVSAGIAVRFGRAAHLLMLALFGAIVVLLIQIGRKLDSPKRIFLFVYGAWLVGLAVLNSAECLCLFPPSGTCVPLVSFGMTQCIAAGLGLGIIFSLTHRS